VFDEYRIKWYEEARGNRINMRGEITTPRGVLLAAERAFDAPQAMSWQSYCTEKARVRHGIIEDLRLPYDHWCPPAQEVVVDEDYDRYDQEE